MKQTINDKRLAVLEDTVKYYSKAPVSRRCRNSKGCRYTGEAAERPKSEGCAVGRIMPKALAVKLDKIGGTSVSSVFFFHERGEIKLSKKILDLGVSFLSHLQALHDAASCWTSRGLSDYGKRKVECIKASISDGGYD